MKAKLNKKKLVLNVDDGGDEIITYQTPSMKKAEEDRNKVIPNYVMDAIKSAFPQRKLSNFFESQQKDIGLQRGAGLETHVEQHVDVPPVKVALEEKKAPETQVEIIEHTYIPTVEKLIGTAAVNISRELKANFIVTIEKGSGDTRDLSFEDVKIVIFKANKSSFQRYTSYVTKLKKQVIGSVLPVKEILMEAVNKKYIGKGNKIVFIGGGESVGSWLKGFFFIFDIDEVFFSISTHHLSENINADVIEAVLSLAEEIGSEGREGRKIGTAFIIGKRDELFKYTKPLLKINPFGNLPEESRKITDPDMKETVKNLAQLDGVFLIDDSGTIITAGAYINIDQYGMELQGLQGFGTRHRCTAAMTKLTDAIGVVVSESGGVVRIYKQGKQILKMP